MFKEQTNLPTSRLLILKKTVIAIGLILFGLTIGIILELYIEKTDLYSNLNQVKEVREKGHMYISPLVDSEPRNMSTLKSLVKLEWELNKMTMDILDNTNKYHTNKISVYYKEFSTGAWIGINEKENFTPASLLKLPLLIAYYKIAESDPKYLSTKIKYVQRSEPLDQLVQNITPTNILKDEQTYSVDELINHMILYSDNAAMSLLLDNMTLDKAKETYSDLGLNPPNELTPEDFMSVKDYASFFRILYNASYLDKELSSKALELLTKTVFEKGLKAGLPKGILVAHKFGERGYENSYVKQLHDCGIVYKPQNPYLICIMTRGENIENLEKVIGEISKFIYESTQN